MRLVRNGPARRKRGSKPPEALSDSDSQHGACMLSEFEDQDGDLAEYLQANTSFLMAMQSTKAFTVSRMCINSFFFLGLCVVLRKFSCACTVTFFSRMQQPGSLEAFSEVFTPWHHL